MSGNLFIGDTHEGKWDPGEASVRAGSVFKPGIPINQLDFFVGRIDKINSVSDAIYQSGQHVVIYGERGVGKTSLARIIRPLLSSMNRPNVVIEVSAHTKDTFSSLWKQALSRVEWTESQDGIGFRAQQGSFNQNMFDYFRLSDECTPDEVRYCLLQETPFVFVFDEFDRLNQGETTAFTDLIKSLADYDVNTTIIIVGVATSVGVLIKRHLSLKRNLVQVPLERMSDDEIHGILSTGATTIGMRFDDNAAQQIASMSQGLPHYAHWVGLHSVRAACKRNKQTVGMDEVEAGLRDTVTKAEVSIVSAYHLATSSPRKDALFREVLLACALTETDQEGRFTQSQIVKPLSMILGREITAGNFKRHLDEFCKKRHGAVLERTGTKYRRKFRFVDPLFPPYVIIRGMKEGLVAHDEVFGESDYPLFSQRD